MKSAKCVSVTQRLVLGAAIILGTVFAGLEAAHASNKKRPMPALYDASPDVIQNNCLGKAHAYQNACLSWSTCVDKCNDEHYQNVQVLNEQRSNCLAAAEQICPGENEAFSGGNCPEEQLAKEACELEHSLARELVDDIDWACQMECGFEPVPPTCCEVYKFQECNLCYEVPVIG